MGKKSEKKKVRSDRINILRKQYDLFLEEDKKRKERNDYILERLEKMRYTPSTVFQLRPKVFSEYNQPTYNRFDYRPENIKTNDVIPHQQINQTNLQLDIPRQFDDISILREISKKYILIPKSRTFIPDNYVVEAMPPPHDNKPVFSEPKTNTVDNGDWRSKYDILEQLKNKEKEEDNNQPNRKEAMASNELSYKNAPENNAKNYEIQNNYEDLPNKYETELPEKDLTTNNFLVENELADVENLKISDNPAQLETKAVQFLKPAEINSNTYAFSEQIPNVESNVMEHNVPVAEDAQYAQYQQEQNTAYDEKAQEFTAYNEGSEQLAEYQNYPNEYEVQNPEAVPQQENIPQSQENEMYVNENDYSPIQTMNPSELVQEIHNGPEVQNDNTAEIEYPIDVINVAEFTPADNVQLQDGVNINPEYVPIQQTYDTSNAGIYVANQESNEQGNVKRHGTRNEEINEQQNIAPTAEVHVDNSGIEAFDAEQKEMFYSEQLGEYAYDQQAAGEAYDPEYVPNAEYQENPDYNYYGELDQKEAYPVEINEHEETNQRYDPNYEQQYAPTQQQDYDDPQIYEQNQQQFEQNLPQYDQNQQQQNQQQFVQNQPQYDQNQQQQNQQQYEQNQQQQNQQQYEQNQPQYDQNQQQFQQNQPQYEQNQQQYEQNQPQYEQPALYEQMQEGYEQYAYEQQNKDTTQDVEKVLDKEEGYVQPKVAEKKAPIGKKKVTK